MKMSENINEKNDNRVVDMLLSRNVEASVDSESMILETQKRVWGALKKGYEYSGVHDESEDFLRKNVFSKLDMMVLYVDLVGSTKMALEMPSEKIATIISSFAQEMAAVIRQHHGYILKFVGDAVIGYFVAESNSLLTADNAVNCAKSMNTVIQKGINPILDQYDYPDLMVKIGVDFGQNIVVRYGADEQHSHVGEELRLECNWETFANSGIRYSDPMTIEGGGMEIPISSLSGVTDKNSLLTMCYGHLKTGELSGGIDV